MLVTGKRNKPRSRRPSVFPSCHLKSLEACSQTGKSSFTQPCPCRVQGFQGGLLRRLLGKPTSHVRALGEVCRRAAPAHCSLCAIRCPHSQCTPPMSPLVLLDSRMRAPERPRAASARSSRHNPRPRLSWILGGPSLSMAVSHNHPFSSPSSLLLLTFSSALPRFCVCVLVRFPCHIQSAGLLSLSFKQLSLSVSHSFKLCLALVYLFQTI